MPSSVEMRWNEADFLRAVGMTSASVMEMACQKVADDVRTSFGAAPPEPKKRGGGFKKRISRKWRHANRSKPGEPPHVDTGRLRASISYRISDGRKDGPKASKLPDSEAQTPTMVGVVGTDVEYAAALELGAPSRNLAARPYLRPALERNLPYIKRLFKTAFGGQGK